jgi:hypothetical protein
MKRDMHSPQLAKQENYKQNSCNTVKMKNIKVHHELTNELLKLTQYIYIQCLLNKNATT